jgi:hypothetical protein
MDRPLDCALWQASLATLRVPCPAALRLNVAKELQQPDRSDAPVSVLTQNPARNGHAKTNIAGSTHSALSQRLQKPHTPHPWAALVIIAQFHQHHLFPHLQCAARGQGPQPQMLAQVAEPTPTPFRDPSPWLTLKPLLQLRHLQPS